MTMTNKKMLAILLASADKTQAQAAKILNKFPQSLNMTVNNNNLRVCDLLTMCDAFDISIDFKDSNNNVVLSLYATHKGKTDGTLPADASEDDATNTPAK